MKKITWHVIALIFSTYLFADQAAWVTKWEANKAAQYVKIGDVMWEYCAPCSDKKATRIEVLKTSVDKVGVERYYELIINGTGVDLAYVYVKQNTEFENLAMLSGIAVKDVPRFLSDGMMLTREDKYSESAENLIAALTGVQMLIALESLELLMEDDIDKLEYVNVAKDGLIVSADSLEKYLDDIFQNEEEKKENELIISIFDGIATAYSSYSSYLEFGNKDMLDKTNYYFESVDNLLEELIEP